MSTAYPIFAGARHIVDLVRARTTQLTAASRCLGSLRKSSHASYQLPAFVGSQLLKRIHPLHALRALTPTCRRRQCLRAHAVCGLVKNPCRRGAHLGLRGSRLRI
jgi:hypothetical protein